MRITTWIGFWPDVFIPDWDAECAQPKSGLWRQEYDRSNACETFIRTRSECDLERKMGQDPPHMSVSKIKWQPRVGTYRRIGGCPYCSAENTGFLLGIKAGLTPRSAPYPIRSTEYESKLYFDRT